MHRDFISCAILTAFVIVLTLGTHLGKCRKQAMLSPFCLSGMAKCLFTFQEEGAQSWCCYFLMHAA
eukprot:1158586-Pelagomonas_calceolata.AAC.9